MRKSVRAALLVLVSIVATCTLCVASAFAAALAFGAIALVVPGTGTPNANNISGYMQNARDRFIDPVGEDVCTEAGCLTGVNYPASFWPIPLDGWCPNLRCDTWNASVGTGVTNLNEALGEQIDNPTPLNDQIILFGYSQGGAVVSRAMYDIADEDKDRISVITIGNINNPLGLWSRLSFLRYIPILNISFGPQLPTDIGVKSTNYSFEYDPVGDAPQYWGNPLAVVNAVLALEYVHGHYLDPNSKDPTDSLPYGYTNASLAAAIAAAPKRVYGDATFVLIPQRDTLPIFMPLVEIGNATGTSALIDPVVRLLQPVTKLLIDLGYDRTTNPGIARNLSILPFNPATFNPVRFSVDFVEAVVQGIEDAFRGNSMIAVPVPKPTEDETGDQQEPSLRLAANVQEDLEPTTEPETAPEPVSDNTTTEELEEAPEGSATVTPVIDTSEGDLDADNAGTADDEAVKEELEQDDATVEEDVEIDEDSLQQDDEAQDDRDAEEEQADSVKEDDVKDSPKADATDSDQDERAAA